ncbi:hypothetical protein [Thalassococcus sp. S3]|uniref:hypothetical protein n=1 Tax=Thalassococcus sp. S3 TaxID=2017482 RepID=UPI0010247F12|nr:hypothetical protein [Thalassococcus sp. S3]QBF31495.1 hypothetical protein CFI11_09740 [Thalassococcus sp. S3]
MTKQEPRPRRGGSYVREPDGELTPAGKGSAPKLPQKAADPKPEKPTEKPPVKRASNAKSKEA